MTEPKEQAVPVVGVEEAVERLTRIADVWEKRDGLFFDVSSDLRTILQALQGSSEGLGSFRPSGSIPTVQAETAVVGALRFYGEEWWHEPNGDPRIPGDAKGWTCEPSDKLIADEGRLAREVLETLGYYAGGLSQPPVSTGEQPGMSEEPFGWSIEGSFLLCGEHVFTKSPEIRDAWSGQEAEGVTVVPLYTSAPTLPDDLLSLSEAATQGEWGVEDPMDHCLTIVANPADPVYDWKWVATCDFPTEEDRAISAAKVKKNAALIVASVNFIRTLAAKQGGKSHD